MKILLDTHIIIWIMEGNSSLSTKHLALISDTKNEKFVSEFSFIELAIKLNIGKLPDFRTPMVNLLSRYNQMDLKYSLPGINI